MTCPRCGEERLLEQVGKGWAYCQVCSWSGPQ